VQVYVRLRPPANGATVPTKNYKMDDENPTRVTIRSTPTNQHAFAFNKVFGTSASQEELFTETTQRLCDHVLEGYNACSFAYGQTGSVSVFASTPQALP
jgi:hypothetical protein